MARGKCDGAKPGTVLDHQHFNQKQRAANPVTASHGGARSVGTHPRSPQDIEALKSAGDVLRKSNYHALRSGAKVPAAPSKDAFSPIDTGLSNTEQGALYANTGGRY